MHLNVLFLETGHRRFIELLRRNGSHAGSVADFHSKWIVLKIVIIISSDSELRVSSLNPVLRLDAHQVQRLKLLLISTSDLLVCLPVLSAAIAAAMHQSAPVAGCKADVLVQSYWYNTGLYQ